MLEPIKRSLHNPEKLRLTRTLPGTWAMDPGSAAHRSCAAPHPGHGSSSLELRLALFHEGLPALAKIFRVHAGHADRLDRAHVALVLVLQHLRDGDLGRLHRERGIA